MSKPMLPALTLRETRVRLLAWTLEDALLGGTLDGGGQDSATARLNLHPELWTQGSYQEFERALDSATRRVRRFVRRQYVETPLRLQPQQLTPELKQVTALMPRNIYVPVDVAVAAGYLEGQAGYFEIPRSERLRRFHRTLVD